MAASLFLFGLNHAHQLYKHHTGASEKLRIKLLQLVPPLRLELLAEEFSSEAITAWGSEISTLQEVAKEFSVPHLFCDPNNAERQALGIKSYEQIRNELGFGSVLTETEDCLVKSVEREKYWPLREAEWLNRILKTASNRTLLLLGSCHVDSLTQTNQFRVTVLERQWEP